MATKWKALGGENEITFKTVRLFKNQTLGSGSYGAVCKAQCDSLPCAAKLLYPMFFDLNISAKQQHSRLPIEQFEKECRLLSQIKHPNIVQYIGTDRDPDTNAPVLLMELMDGNLTNLLETSHNPLQLHFQLSILHDIALAVSFLHHNKIIHRDLSSNNVLISKGYRAKVTDFGMSKLTSDPYVECTTECPGTPAYMPPEALDTPAVYSEKLDCFSFGVLVVQIITRKLPSPTSRFKTMNLAKPTQPSHLYEAQIRVSEWERRQNHIALIPVVNPLRQLALDCLKDRDIERPTAQQLCERISTTQKSTNSDVATIRTQPSPAYKTVLSASQSVPMSSTTPLPAKTSTIGRSERSRSASTPSAVAKDGSATLGRTGSQYEMADFIAKNKKPLRIAPQPPTRSNQHSVPRHQHKHSEFEMVSITQNGPHLYDEIPELLANRPQQNLTPKPPPPLPRSPPPSRDRPPTSPRSRVKEHAPSPPPRRPQLHTSNKQQVVNEEPRPPPRPPKPSTHTSSLRAKSWYHSSLDRKQAEAKLRIHNKDGTFIVRDSSKIPGEYSLSISYNNTIIHLRIEVRPDKKFTLGEGKPAFETVNDFVEYHKKHSICFKTGGAITLKFECPR